MFGQAVILIKPNNDFSAFFYGGTGFVLHKDCGEELLTQQWLTIP